MNTICPTCSAPVSGDYAVGDLVDCPACGAVFEARPVATPATADDMLRRAERYAAEQRLNETFEKLDGHLKRQRSKERFDRISNALDRFSKNTSKIGKQLFVGAMTFPLLIMLIYFLWTSIFG